METERMSLGPLMVDVAGQSLGPEDREVLRHPLVGSVILFSRNYADPAQLVSLVAEMHALRDPPLVVAVDHEGGRVQRFRKHFTVLPAARLIGHRYDIDADAGLEMARSCAWLLASELRAVGIDLSFAPVVDLDYGVSEVIGDRAYHRDADAVSALTAACMAGMREAGMACVAKHFPGHGAVVADSHFTLPIDRRELADMDADLAPYRRLIANGLPAIMAAHVVYSEVDERPASFSRRWITDVLRGDLRFHGVVFADDLNMAAAVTVGSMLDRANYALEAGCDVLPICNNRPGVHEVLGGLRAKPNPASQARLVRLHGRPAPDRETLLASARWQAASQELARNTLRPELSLDSGRA
jgi:beta-N-acetylhexosaminidase